MKKVPMDRLRKTLVFLVRNGGFTATTLSNYLTRPEEVTAVYSLCTWPVTP